MTETPRTVRRTVPGHYHLARTMMGHQMGRGDPTLRIDTDRVELGMQTPDGAVSVRADHRGDALESVLWGAGADWLAERLDGLFGLTDDADSFKPAESVIASLARRYRGMHLPRLPRVFDRIVQVVLLQLVTRKEALTAWRRMVTKLGEPAPGPLGVSVPARPADLARTSPEVLRFLGVAPRQANTLRRVAGVADALERAADRGPETLAKRLAEIPGIGRWTVEYVLGSGLGVADAVLIGDYNLPNTVAWVLAGEPRADDNRMLELLEPYRGHRFRVVRLLWMSGKQAPRRGPRHPLR